MKFGTYQVSRKGGREKNEDRMGYCYTRDSGLFALADGMGGHPEARSPRSSRCRRWRPTSRRKPRPT